jgi:hypothetical protein
MSLSDVGRLMSSEYERTMISVEVAKSHLAIVRQYERDIAALRSECERLQRLVIDAIRNAAAVEQSALERGAETMALLAFDEGFDYCVNDGENSTQPSHRRRRLEKLMQLWRESK